MKFPTRHPRNSQAPRLWQAMPGAYVVLHSPRSLTVGTRHLDSQWSRSGRSALVLGPIVGQGGIGVCFGQQRGRLQILARRPPPGESGVVFSNHPNAHGVNTGGLQAPLFKVSALLGVISEQLLGKTAIEVPAANIHVSSAKGAEHDRNIDHRFDKHRSAWLVFQNSIGTCKCIEVYHRASMMLLSQFKALRCRNR